MSFHNNSDAHTALVASLHDVYATRQPSEDLKQSGDALCVTFSDLHGRLPVTSLSSFLKTRTRFEKALLIAVLLLIDRLHARAQIVDSTCDPARAHKLAQYKCLL